MALLLVVERIVCAIVAALMASAASVMIDGSCPAPKVDYRAGYPIMFKKKYPEHHDPTLDDLSCIITESKDIGLCICAFA